MPPRPRRKEDSNGSLILLAYKLQWAESAARLEQLKKANHDDAIKTLGGEPFLKELRACHKEYGDALGVTEVPFEKVTATIREALDAFSTSLRKYALAVTAFAEDDDDDKGAAALADALLAPLSEWESTSASERGGADAGEPGGVPSKGPMGEPEAEKEGTGAQDPG